MRYSPPQPIQLTKSEAELYARITDEPAHDGWHEVADAIEDLMQSLLARNAIPEVRLSLFSDPAYAETGSKSRRQVFESNGTSGTDIFRHPNFLPYLQHFVNGPNLPKSVIEGLCKILNEDVGTSGMLLDQYRAHARASVREHGLNTGYAATEFFRLGVEIGMEIGYARSLRDATKSAK